MICGPHGMMNDRGECPYCRIGALVEENKDLRDACLQKQEIINSFNEVDKARGAECVRLKRRLESEEAHYARLVEQHKAELDAISDIPNIEDWLLSREQDIAFGIEDFGDLKPLFVCLFRRQPEKNPVYG